MRIVDRDHAVLRPLDISAPLPPWKLQRVPDGGNIKIASDWPGEKPATPQIAALQATLKRMADEDQAVRTAHPISEKRMQEVDRIPLPPPEI